MTWCINNINTDYYTINSNISSIGSLNTRIKTDETNNRIDYNYPK